MIPDERKYDVAIVGAGVVGLAHALAAARSGRRVIVFERDARPQGTSTRSFGLVMPLAARPGRSLERALRSRAVWLELAQAAHFWQSAPGSLLLAYHADELSVLAEFNHLAREHGYDVELLSRQQVLDRCPSVNATGLLGALFSRSEVLVDPREAVSKIPGYLARTYHVTMQWQTPVTAVQPPLLEAGGRTWKAEQVIVCSGTDFDTLYAEVLDRSGLKRCRLQMMRTGPQPRSWRMGPMLAGGLTLAQYPSFAGCASLDSLKARLERDYPRCVRWGIHVMAVQNGRGEVTIGDSHQYDEKAWHGRSEEVDGLILRILNGMLNLPNTHIRDRWENQYAKHFGQDVVRLQPEPAVDIVTGFGGMDLTTGFAVAEELFAAG